MKDTATVQSPPRKGELSGDRLLEISATLFRKRGYTATTMRDIAEAAGMKAGSLYYHFQSKDELLELVLERGIAEAIRGFKAALAALPAGAPFADRFRAVIVAHLRTVVEFGTYTVASRQLLGQVPDGVRDRHLAMRRVYDGLWRDLLSEGKASAEISPKVDYALVRQFLLGSLNWSSEWVDPQRKSCEELGRLAADLFLNGLNPD